MCRLSWTWWLKWTGYKMPDFVLRDGVPDEKPSPAMMRGRLTAARIHAEMWGEPLTITSTTDGKHMAGSKHYDVPHNAEDVRFPHKLRIYLQRLRTELGEDFDVVLEKDHIHIEHDPKPKGAA